MQSINSRGDIPRRPVFSWAGLRPACPEDTQADGSLRKIPHLLTTSGRAALFHALRLLDMPAGAAVLVPTYHCPTMIAPVIAAGFGVEYYCIEENGLPKIDELSTGAAKAIIVPHYFGLPQSFAGVRKWCDQHGIALIEDCAHSLYGMAGERPVGGWGDVCAASITKFFPVPEAGLIASTRLKLGAIKLQQQGLLAQIKGVVRVLEYSAEHRGLPGVNTLLRGIFALLNGRRRRQPSHPAQGVPEARGQTEQDEQAAARAALRDCDMSRADSATLKVAEWIWERASVGSSLAQRRRNFSLFDDGFRELAGVRFPAGLPRVGTAPYVYPLLVDDADRIYAGLRERGLAVLRWDRVWPGAPSKADDTGLFWRRHLLQFLCHQDLGDQEILFTIRSLRELLVKDDTSLAEAPVTAH